jgi:hypothetical protein
MFVLYLQFFIILLVLGDLLGKEFSKVGGFLLVV